MTTHSLKSFMAHATLFLGIAQLVLVVLSWLLSAFMGEGSVRSLLTNEGVRWFFSSFVDNLSSPWLAWLVLIAFAVNAVRRCGLLRYRSSEYRQRLALWLVLVETVAFVALLGVLSLAPHAVLLSVTGSLFPGPFTQSLLPYVCFALCVMSVSFAWMSGKCHGVVGAFDLLTSRLHFLSPLLLLYVFLVQLSCSLSYVFHFSFPCFFTIAFSA